MTTEEKIPKMQAVCKRCGSDDVSCDATVRWDMEQQAWGLADVHDGEFCADCGDETTILMNEVPDA